MTWHVVNWLMEYVDSPPQVLYIGKIKVSHRKVPESFIDDALEKFRLHDLEKEREKEKGLNAGKAILMRNNSNSRIVPPAVAAAAVSADRRGSQVRASDKAA